MSSMDELSAIDALCRVDLPEEKHELPNRGLVLTLRGLSHDEGLSLEEYGKKEGITNAMYEQRMLSQAVVWPKMSAGQVKAWQKAASAGELNGVVEVVMRLSGMGKDAAKEAYKSVSGEPESGE